MMSPLDHLRRTLTAPFWLALSPEVFNHCRSVQDAARDFTFEVARHAPMDYESLATAEQYVLSWLAILRAYEHTRDAYFYIHEYGECPNDKGALKRLLTESNAELARRITGAIFDAIETGEHDRGIGKYANEQLVEHIRRVRLDYNEPERCLVTLH